MAKLQLSRIVQEQMKKPSPIRQIMKMADRQNIINMGLDPDDIMRNTSRYARTADNFMQVEDIVPPSEI
jgi:hypothetical protein